MRPYDSKNKKSILAFASRLTGKSLRQALMELGLGSLIRDRRSGKGYLGQDVERLYYGLPPSSESEPDFKEVGLELKTTGLRKTRVGLRPKERLVLSIIDFMGIERERHFEKSAFWKKNADILLHCYLYAKEKDHLDLVFLLEKEWTFPEPDRRIIEADWGKIAEKVRAGKAHELSERDTFYLGACTKGATRKTLRTQPHGPRAMQRAYSLKAKYVLRMIDREFARDSGSFIRDASVISATREIGDLFLQRFEHWYGQSMNKLKARFGIASNAKDQAYLLAKAMLGIRKKQVAEFENAEIQVKTICVENSGSLKESMSFKNIRFCDIVDEKWEESQFHRELDRRFLFVIFQKNKTGEPILCRAMFWAIPEADLKAVARVWKETKDKIWGGIYDEFVRISDDRIAHVRPKGRNRKDLMPTPQGTMERKKCFWLNASYIKQQIAIGPAPDFKGRTKTLS